MKVVFVLPDFNYAKEYDPDYSETGCYYLGPGYISSYLKKAGHQVSLIHLLHPISRGEFQARVLKEKPDLIAFSFFTHQFLDVKVLISWLKDLEVPIICGGVHPTVDPESVLSLDEVDMVCIGEGEQTIVELCNKLEGGEDITKIQSLWIKKDDRIVKNPVRPLVEDLDSLPFPDRSIFDYHAILRRTGKLDVIATRGCPFECSYCCNHQYKRLYPNARKYVRFRKVSEVIREIKEVNEKYPYCRFVELLDDTSCLNKRWMLEFCKEYKKLGIASFRANTRADMLDEELVAAMKDAGCERLMMGIESGNETIREKVLNRRMSNEKIISTFKLCHKYGIETVSYNIVGIPFEGLREILDTIKLNAIIRPTSMHVSILQPYPYTRIYDLCIVRGWLRGKQAKGFFTESVLELPTLSKRDIFFAYRLFMFFVRMYSITYKLPKPLARAACFMLDQIFLERRLHGMLLTLSPIFDFICHPQREVYRFLYQTFPGPAKKLKKAYLDRKRKR
jgi:radical SAM superfamily enzyme YgiQ (UPF0313 family)